VVPAAFDVEIQYNVAGGVRTFTYRFRDRSGKFSTRDWVIPRLPGSIVAGQLKLYAYCHEARTAPDSVSLTIGQTPYVPIQTGTQPPVYEFTTGAMSAGQWIKIGVTCGGVEDISLGQILPS